MLDCIKGQLLRRSKSEESNMKINILLCGDDNFFAETCGCIACQPLPKGAVANIIKYSCPTAITDR